MIISRAVIEATWVRSSSTRFCVSSRATDVIARAENTDISTTRRTRARATATPSGETQVIQTSTATTSTALTRVCTRSVVISDLSSWTADNVNSRSPGPRRAEN